MGDRIKLFFGGDTPITANHKLFGALYKPDLAVLGVGGVKQMGQSFTELHPDEAALVAKWLGVKVALPIHYRQDEGVRFTNAVNCPPSGRTCPCRGRCRARRTAIRA